MNMVQADCRTIFDAVSDAILIHDGATGKILDVNQGMCEMFGYTPEEARGLKMAALYDHEAGGPPELVGSLPAGTAAGTPQVFEARARDRRGRIFWVEAYLKPVSLDGRDRILAVLRDIDQRKQVEAALQTQTRVLESMGEGVALADADGRIIFANPAFEAMFGYQPGELIGQPLSGLSDFSASESASFVKEMVGHLTTRGILSGEVRNRKKDGTTFFTQARLSPLEISGQTGWILVQEDITERRQVEDALRQSEASYRIVTEASLAGVYLIQDGLFRYVNPVLAQAFGYSPDEIIDRLGPSDLLDPEDRDRILGVVERRLAGEGLPSRSNFKGMCKDGSVIHVETLSRHVEYHGRPAVMGTFLDITEKWLAEEALKASEEKYRTIFGAINDAIVVMDPETGQFLEVNQKYLEICGFEPETVAELSLARVCSADPPFRIQEARELMKRAVEEGPQLFEWLAEDQHGHRFWIEINLTLTLLGGQHRLLAVIRDISERKQMEEVRRRAFDELEGLVAERTAGLQAANAQLLSEIEERRHTEAIIRLQRDLALTLGAGVDMQEALRVCLETAITISGLDSGGIYLVDPVSGNLDLAYHQGLSAEFVQQVAHYPADSLNAYMVMAGRPLYARLQDLPGILDEKGLKEGLRSATVIPVIHQDRVIAAINIASHQHEEVPATTRTALEALAAQVGSAIARVQAEEALRRAKEDLEIRVAERTAQLKETNESLEQELRARQSIEQSLRHSEAKYRTLVEQIPAITYIISLEAGVNLTYVSPQIETILGFSPKEWRTGGRETWERQIHPEERERVLAEIARSFKSGEPFAAEYRLLAKSGRVVWFRDEARVVHDKEGEPLFLQGLALDITKRKQAEEALKETSQTLQALIQSAPLAIIAMDPDFRIRLWNPEAERMFGWQESEVLGKGLPFFQRDQWEEARVRLRRQMTGEVESGLELRRMRKDGSPIDTQLWTASLKNAKGEITGLVGMLADVTARKRAEEALRESEANYRTIFNGVNDGIAVVDMATGNFLDFNQKWLEMNGFTAEEARGLNVAALCLPGGEFSAEEALGRVQKAARQGSLLFEWLAQTKDGRPHWVEVNLKRAVINNQDRLLTVVRDISERKLAQEKLRRQAELLDLAQDAIIVRDLEDRIIFWNSGAEETYGWGKGEVKGRLTSEILDTEYPKPVRKLNAELFRQGQWQGELTHTRRDGRRIVVASRWALQRDRKGQPAAILEINRDISERKLAEAGRTRLAAILEATSDLVGTADLQGRVLYLNRAGRQMLGIGLEEDASRFTVKDLQPRWASRLIREHYDVEAVGPQVWSGETTFLTRRGREIPTSQVVIAHKDAAGRAEFFSTVARDITETKRAEEALKESERELRLLTAQILGIQEQERRRVARELHDELGQALTVLKIQLVAIEEQLAPDQQPLQANCEQMLSYIDTVIENVRRLSWDLSPSSLEDLGLSSALGHLVDETCRNNNMECVLGIDDIDQLFSPETQINIYRIFQESLTNVVKHAGASRVSVKVNREDAKVSFRIRDNGGGFNVKQAMSSKAAKRSLGLTAMNERALMARGSLKISSRRGRGTTIVFSIPTDEREN